MNQAALGASVLEDAAPEADGPQKPDALKNPEGPQESQGPEERDDRGTERR